MNDADLMDDQQIRRSAKAAGPRQCTAKSKRSRRRCKRAPIRGGRVCSFHGGAAPQVKKTARERLAALAEPAIAALKRALEEGDINATLKAAQLILDRTGFHPSQTITGGGAAMPGSFTFSIEPVTEIKTTFVDPIEKYLKWIPEDRIALMRAWFREGMLAEQQKKPPLRDDFEPLLSEE